MLYTHFIKYPVAVYLKQSCFAELFSNGHARTHKTATTSDHAAPEPENGNKFVYWLAIEQCHVFCNLH